MDFALTRLLLNNATADGEEPSMTTGFTRRSLSVLTATALAVVLCASPADAWPSQSAPSRTVDVRLIGINDFHGNLQPPSGSSGRVVIADGTTVDAGGAVYLATCDPWRPTLDS